ncbi:HNH endonuclease, partial [Dolichospermum sp. ST_sed2]|nr:HNH endonuclease [Dolichospermum sp. ST_sed2]
PIDDIAHIDGNRTNNAISNLRECTRSQNMENLKKCQSNNKSGILGVHFNNFTWVMQIKVGNKRIVKKGFSTAKEAGEAYIEEKRKNHNFCTI